MRPLRVGQVVANYAQDSYNCGIYSLWMAMESVANQGININALKNASKTTASNWGGLFSTFAVYKLVSAYDIMNAGTKFDCLIKDFTDINSLRNLIINSPQTEALMIAYDCTTALVGVGPQEANAADGAHWSIITQFNMATSDVTLANPWGRNDNIPLARLFAANTRLNRTVFDTLTFFSNQGLQDPAYQVAQSIYSGVMPHHRQLARTSLDLANKLVVITVR